MAREDNSLDQVDPTNLGESEGTNGGIGERKEGDFRERSSTFSLEFPTIRPSVFGEARSKVAPHGKDYAWVLVLESFEKLRKGRGFSPTCFTLCLRVILMGVDLLMPGWSWFRFQKIWTE